MDSLVGEQRAGRKLPHAREAASGLGEQDPNLVVNIRENFVVYKGQLIGVFCPILIWGGCG
jgi:hypothetical protein